ncbi:hypothetical protein H8356DRAFT_1425994 [Neocallimastix lanati (nom. inval.)]|nr:hypothetical protein H8356DRAFT_1425994 [Neocallimastix sp. JGI-2020a]
MHSTSNLSETEPLDTKVIAEKLSKPPFNKNYSVIDIHDKFTSFQLFEIINEVLIYIDDSPTSVHRVNLRTEPPESTVQRIVDFLYLLKYKPSIDRNPNLKAELLDGDRHSLQCILYFLLNQLETHKKRAYLAPFLSVIVIPPEFLQDDAIQELNIQLKDLQSQFIETHKYVEQLRQSGNATNDLKKEIQQTEEEKQQVLVKIGRLRKKVEKMPNHEQWLEAARKLRIEQTEESNIVEKMKEQNEQLKIAEKKLIEVRKSLKQVQSANATSNADLLWQRMEEETKMNRFIATENLPKAINDKQKNIDNITRILTETSTSESDLQVSEMEIRDLNEAIAKLAEKKLTKNRNAGNDKLALFRQQANIIALKKEGTAEKIHSLVEKLNQLNEELEKKEGAKGESETKILKGEEFKKYVSELRTKSSVYKRKKVELSELTTELGVLQRTDEILKNHIKDFQDSIYKIEKENGIVGYHDTQETLEKVSEKKNEMDETKGKTLNEISSLVDKIVQTINDKKAVLTTVIQEVRALRTKAQDLETDYIEKKKVYDTTIASLESDSCALEQEVRGYRQDIINDQSRYHYLNAMLNISEISLDRVLQETKAYIGGDEKFEEIQKIRGFKSYRELYNKKLNEQENLGEMLRNTQKEVKACHEADMKQLEMFKNIKKLLDLKIETNRKLLLGEKNNEEFEGQMVQDRLIL